MLSNHPWTSWWFYPWWWLLHRPLYSRHPRGWWYEGRLRTEKRASTRKVRDTLCVNYWRIIVWGIHDEKGRGYIDNKSDWTMETEDDVEVGEECSDWIWDVRREKLEIGWILFHTSYARKLPIDQNLPKLWLKIFPEEAAGLLCVAIRPVLFHWHVSLPWAFFETTPRNNFMFYFEETILFIWSLELGKWKNNHRGMVYLLLVWRSGNAIPMSHLPCHRHSAKRQSIAITTQQQKSES